MIKKIFLLTCTLMVYILFSSTIVQAAPNKVSSKGNGTINSYEMTVEALEDSDITKLHIKVYSDIPGYNTLYELKKVQVKAFDENGNKVLTKNYFNIPLDNGLGIIELNSGHKLQNLRVTTWIKTDQSVDQEILREDNVPVSLKQDLAAAPMITDAQAADTGNSAGLNAGDTITVKFDIDTNQPTAAGKYNVDNLIDFGMDKSLGSNYTGIWVDAKTLLIRILDAAGSNICIGDSIKIKQDGNLKNADNTSENCSSSFAIGGTFGDDKVIIVSFKDPNLESAVRAALYIPQGDITNLDMAKLMRLVVSGRQIKDLSGLEYGININVLYLAGNEITDITPISNLQNLKELYLDGNGIKTITGLSSLGSLQSLSISENEITDISPLESMTTLEELDASHNGISDISALKDMVNMRELNLSYNMIEDVSALENLKNLQSLNLSYNSISIISGLSNLTNLTSLSIEKNQCSDILAVQGLVNLQYLNFSQNKVEDTMPLIGLTNLRKLYMASNAITDISGLENLVNLDTLDLSNNGVNHIATLGKLVKLNTLKLDSTRVSDITPLKDLKNLQGLYMNSCGISDISPLRGLTNMYTIVLSNNDIGDISSLEALTNLRWVILLGNSINDISSLVTNSKNGGIGSGDYIDLTGNQLDITEGSKNMQDIQSLITSGAIVKYGQ